jgi:hypothetical protein
MGLYGLLQAIALPLSSLPQGGKRLRNTVANPEKETKSKM